MNHQHAVLLLVDIQPDFMPGGALAVEGADKIVEPVRRLMESDRFGLQVATQDWHPAEHISFASRHAGRKPFESIELYGHPQTLWPDHCVQGTIGAQLHPKLLWDRVAAIVRKGMDPECDSYSGFRNNWNINGERPATGLTGYLRERGIREVYVCGLARDVCVRWTAEDAVDAGFHVYFLWDVTCSVNPADDQSLQQALIHRGVILTTTEELKG
ncbi:MAG TPA: bifunctional nicotinamidase/pyrazinamidase [Candidatus Competibacteraceae bacterium]|mgnify:CR=1 FL=1|nr:bifunctional nicotinamidase/pyrazinamidase [Candidatus Competibacteraceae bacterium]